MTSLFTLDKIGNMLIINPVTGMGVLSFIGNASHNQIVLCGLKAISRTPIPVTRNRKRVGWPSGVKRGNYGK